MSGVHRTYRLRSNSVPSRSRWSTPRPEFTFVLNRPWTPGNKEVDRLGGLCDINILDVLKVEDLEKFRDELEKASENGNFDMAAFRDFMMSWPVKANSWQIERLFRKIDVEDHGVISWDDICTFIMQGQCTNDKNCRKVVEFKPETRVHALIHKDRVARIVPLEHHGAFIVGSNDGLLTTWTRDLQLLKKSSLKSSLQSQPCGKKWYTDFMYLNDMNKMVATTGDRELEFFELSTCQFYFRINELDTVPMCLSYGKLPNSDQHAIVWGDSNGNVSILLLRDFADLLRRWRTPMHLDVQPTISIAKVVLDEKVKFIRWQTHDEWVAKVHLEESTEKIISCCNRENTAVVIGHIEGSTPPFRDESCPVRQRRDPPSSQSSTSSRTPTSKRTVLKAASFSSPRLFSKFVAKKRISSDQLVFKIHKGVRVFEFSKKKNILVTGGMDRIIRIWNPYLTKSSIGKLIGHSSPTLCLTINVEEGFLISVSSDSCIKV
uniref:WD_REPEATS_REGION domain-containing protein n=2 Tax=Mesocestoides corti TaxID=53468 RepID=A0A5K3F4Z2_MESCO